jgi:hypothetical protein
MAATSRTEVYDAVLTTTARHMNGEIRDNITRSNKLVAWLDGHGKKRMVSGGERIKVPLMNELNAGADIFGGYGQLDTTPADGITSAFFPWAQLAVPITISGLEQRQNNGPEQIKDLLRAKMMQSQASAVELLNNCVTAGKISSGATGSLNQFVARTGRLDSAANGPLPIPALVDADPSRSVSIGDINGNTESFWRNKATASTATTFAGLKQEMNNVYNNARQGAGGPPDLALVDQLFWEVYFNSLQSQERYFVTNQRIINILGGAEEEHLKFRNAILIWDEVVPDVGTSTANIVDGVGTANQSGAHSTGFFLNTESLEYIVHTDADWKQTDFITPVNQDAKVAHLLWQGQLVVNNRRKNAVLYDVDNSIAA